MSQQDASATHPYRGLMVLDTLEKLKKMKNLCILQGRAVTFSGVVDDAVDQWRKRLEACIHAEGGHFEHLL